MLFCHLRIFSKLTFSKNSFRNTISVISYVGPHLDPNCLDSLSADDTKLQAPFTHETIHKYRTLTLFTLPTLLIFKNHTLTFAEGA